MTAPRLAVIAGRGSLPGLLLAECRRVGRPCLVVSFAGADGTALPSDVKAIGARFERLGEMFAALKA